MSGIILQLQTSSTLEMIQFGGENIDRVLVDHIDHHAHAVAAVKGKDQFNWPHVRCIGDALGGKHRGMFGNGQITGNITGRGGGFNIITPAHQFDAVSTA